MNRTAAGLRPEDVAPSRRFLSVMEEFGQISEAEATDWRRRIAAWGRYQEVDAASEANSERVRNHTVG